MAGAGTLPEQDIRMQAFVARQPVLNREVDLFGYELLFRAGLENVFSGIDGDEASAAVISDTLLTIGIQQLTQGGRAFINFPERSLLEGHAMLLPAETVIIELLEHVRPDPEVLDACAALKENGYTLAADDVTDPARIEAFADVIDIVKVDCRAVPRDQWQSFIEIGKPLGKTMLAEKIETFADYAAAKGMGFDLFQGYFFSEPVIVTERRVDQMQPMRLALLQAAHRGDIDFDELERIIRKDVGLTYRLLKYINSAFFGLREHVSSIKQALVLLGTRNVRRWTSLIALEALGEEKPPALLQESIVRARFCELLSDPLGMRDREEDLFLLGMFSLLDAILDRPMNKILEDVPLEKELHEALLGTDNRLRKALDAAISYQRGDWMYFAALREELGFDEAPIPALFYQALAFAQQVHAGEEAE